jgi:predicted DNA-binding transcriptional regulator YafY
MPRNRQVVRELQLLLTLERSRYGRSLQELALEFGVTDRTIRRDLEALEAAGVPLIDNENPHERRWRVLDWRKEAA